MFSAKKDHLCSSFKYFTETSMWIGEKDDTWSYTNGLNSLYTSQQMWTFEKDKDSGQGREYTANVGKL